VLLLSWWLPQVAMVVALLCLLLIGVGCSVEVGRKNDLPTSPKKERVLETNEGTWDLRTPPSREEAGMPSGQPYVIYEAQGWWHETPIQAQVLLPEDKRVDTEANYVALDSYGARCWKHTESSPPTTMDIGVGPVHFEEGYREMLEAADEFGFSQRDIRDTEEWGLEVQAVVKEGESTERIRTPFLRSEVGYLTAEVRASFLPYEHEVEHAYVHYTFSWLEPFDPKGCGKPEETA
jgi:hypothetical protein